jgi:hypothetical protein
VAEVIASRHAVHFILALAYKHVVVASEFWQCVGSQETLIEGKRLLSGCCAHSRHQAAKGSITFSFIHVSRLGSCPCVATDKTNLYYH